MSDNEKAKREDMVVIYSYLDETGIKQSLSGYRYLSYVIYAVSQCFDDNASINMNDIYEELSKKNKCSMYGVRNAMKYALESANIESSMKNYVMRAVLDLRRQKNS